MVLSNSLIPVQTKPSSKNPFIEAKVALKPFIADKVEKIKEKLLQERNPWINKKSIDKRLNKYANDSDTQRLAWINRKETTPLATDQATEMDILKQVQSHRQQAIQRMSTDKSPQPKQIVANLQSYSNNMREEQKLITQMCEERKKNEKTFWSPKLLPTEIDPKDVYPNRSQLIKETSFGKPNLLKSYSVTPALQQVLCHIFKSHFMDTDSEKSICAAIPNAKFLRQKLKEYEHWDFRCLRHPNFDWESSKINEDREKHREACLLFYNGSIEDTQRYCGWRFTGDHRRVQEMLWTIRPVIKEETFNELAPGYIDGVPNFFYANVPYEEFQLYKANATLKNISEHPELVRKQVVKEDSRDLTLTFDERIVDFIQHCGIIQVGIATPELKKPRLYRHGSKKLTDESLPINSIVDAKHTEPEIRFGGTLKRHCTNLYRLRATHPNKHIVGYDDDVCGAFPQRIFHPNVAGANSSLILDRLLACIALHFGSNFGPANLEPICWARIEIAEFLAHNATYMLELNEEVIQLIQVEELKHQSTQKMSNVPLDILNPPAKYDDGITKIKYEMFVDDLLSACVRDTDVIKRMVCASVEALYILLSYPGNINNPELPAAIAIDKFLDRPLGETRISLGTGWDFYSLTIYTPIYKAKRLYDLICSTWHDKRKTFFVLENAKLQGNIIDLLFINPWIRCAYYAILDETKKALRLNRSRVQRQHDFKKLLCEKDDSWLNATNAKKHYAKHKAKNVSIAKAIWRDEHKYVISKRMREEINYVKYQLRRYIKGEVRWQRPISHIVERVNDIGALTDASVKRGLGGWCWTFRIWWQYSWEDIHPDIRKTLINEYLKFKEKLTCINVLELLGIFVAEVAIVVAYNTEFKHKYQWQPTANIGGDNLQANVWSGTKSMANQKARAITKLMSELRMQSNIGFSHPHIEGIENIVADGFSRKDVKDFTKTFKSYSQTEFNLLQQENLGSRPLRLRRFLLEPKILSLMASAILSPSTIDLPKGKLKSWGQISADETISLNSSTK
jgi:hypothetical protein